MYILAKTKVLYSLVKIITPKEKKAVSTAVSAEETAAEQTEELAPTESVSENISTEDPEEQDHD